MASHAAKNKAETNKMKFRIQLYALYDGGIQ
jgi:hypothetical protein